MLPVAGFVPINIQVNVAWGSGKHDCIDKLVLLFYISLWIVDSYKVNEYRWSSTLE